MGGLTRDEGADPPGRPPPGVIGDPALDLVARSDVHELRQPLSVIIGYAELLATQPADEGRLAQLLGAIRRAAWGMAASLERLERAPELELRAFGPRGEWQVLDLRAAPGPESASQEER